MKNTHLSGIFVIGLLALVPAFVHADLAGELEDDLVVTSGGDVLYSIPIQVPKGTAGMEPKLAFSYSSSGSNSIMGWGWSVGGLSSIVRGRQSLFFDDKNTEVTFETESGTGELKDRFYLDGKRLIDVPSNVSGSNDNYYWKASGENEYRTAVDEFAWIKAIGTQGAGPQSFEVRSKSGLTFYYGTTSDSRDLSGSSVYVWLLSKVEDTLGNYYTITYKAASFAGFNHIVPDKIEYTGNTGEGLTPFAEVRYVYESTNRPDRMAGFLQGQERRLDKRLDMIEVYENSTKVWQYDVNYESTSSYSWLPSLVDSIQFQSFVGGGQENLPKTLFDYESYASVGLNSRTKASGFTNLGPWYNYLGKYGENQTMSHPKTSILDGNGNGSQELWKYEDSGNLKIWEFGTDTSNQTTKTELLNLYLDKYNNAAQYPVIEGDFNGDGLTDIVLFYKVDPSYYRYEYRSAYYDIGTGSLSFSVVTTNQPGPHFNTQKIVADFNGDGMQDWASVTPSKTTSGTDYDKVLLGLSIATGTGFNSGSSAAVQNLPLMAISEGVPEVYAIDVNGDFQSDVVITGQNKTSGKRYLCVVLSVNGVLDDNNPYLTDLAVNWDVDSTLVWGDFNGDSLPEFVSVEKDGSYLSYKVYYNNSSSSGLSFQSSTTWTESVSSGMGFHKTTHTAVDIDSDGDDDLIAAFKDPYTNYVQVKKTSFNSVSPYRYTATMASNVGTVESNGKVTRNIFLDYDGDGFLDLMRLRYDGTNMVPDFYLNNAEYMGRLTKITSGLGRVNEIEYRPLSDPQIYEVGYRLGYPFVNVSGGQHVVSTLRQDTGLRTGSTPVLKEMWYTYAEGRAHLRGLGFLGFEQFESYDTSTKMGKVEVIEQAFPMTGMVRYSAVHYWGSGPTSVSSSTDLPNSQRSDDASMNRFLLSETISDITFDLVQNGSIFPMVTKVADKKYTWSTSRSADTWNSGSKRYTMSVSPYSEVTTSTWYDDQATVSPSSPVTALPVGTRDTGDPFDWIDQVGNINDTNFDAEFSGISLIDIKFGNITRLQVDYGAAGKSDAANEFYDSQTTYKNNWLIGRLKKSTTTHTKPGISGSKTKIAEFTYDTSSGLLKTEQITVGSGTSHGLTNRKEFTYDSFGNIWKEYLGWHKDYNPSTSSWSSWVLTQTKELSYSTNGRYVLKELGPMSIANGKSFWTEYSSYTPFGKPGTVTDVNLLSTVYGYDKMGRVTSINTPSSTDSTVTYTKLSTPVTVGTLSPNNKAVLKITKGTTYSPDVIEYIDALGRTVATESETASGDATFAAKLFDNKGRVAEEYATSDSPYLSSNTITGFSSNDKSTFTYDALGRLDETVRPNGMKTGMEYSGLTTTKTINESASSDSQYNQKHVTTKDERGRIVETIRYDGSTTQHKVVNTYDALGDLVQVQQVFPNSTTNTVTYEYDELGNKKKQIDPHQGTWNYVHDSLGRLVWQEDAQGNETTLKYDLAGNLTEKVTGYGTTSKETTTSTHDWSTSLYNGFREIGLLESEVLKDNAGSPIYQKAYGYDDKGRLEIEWAAVDGKWYYQTYDYDAYDRLTDKSSFWKPEGDTNYSLGSTWYPYIVHYTYFTGTRYIQKVSGHDTHTTATGWPGSPTWYTSVSHTWFETTLASYDDKDRVTNYDLGNGVDTTVTYNPVDDSIDRIRSVNGSTVIQDFYYDYDKIGRLTYQAEYYDRTGAGWNEEWFYYDNLNRLDSRHYRIKSGTLYWANIADYDVYGNISTKAGVTGTFTYNSTKKFRLEGLYNGSTTTIFSTYNNNGQPEWQYRPTTGHWIQYTWNSFNKPDWIWNNSTSTGTQFDYDTNGDRYLQIRYNSGSLVEKKLNIMDYEQSYEYISSAWALDYTRIFIDSPVGRLGCYEFDENAGGTNTGHRRYFHFDHQGSVIAVTDGSGTEVNRFSQTAFGVQRNPDTWVANYSDSVLDHEDGGDRGYTGHEMLSDLELVHMNGRVYDPWIGRFVRPDPFVQFPGYTQSYNPYSYVLNNPTSYTDPSGYLIGLDDLALALTVYQLGSTAISAYEVYQDTGSIGDAFSVIASGLIAYSASVAVTSVIGSTFGDPWGGNGFFKDPLLNELARGTTHGFLHGIATATTGGDFQDGAISGFFGSFIAESSQFYLGKDNMLAAFTISVVGTGTVSEIGGGKFANGAVTGAMIFVHNANSVKSWVEEGGIRYRSGLAVISGNKTPNDATVLKEGTVWMGKGVDLAAKALIQSLPVDPFTKKALKEIMPDKLFERTFSALETGLSDSAKLRIGTTLHSVIEFQEKRLWLFWGRSQFSYRTVPGQSRNIWGHRTPSDFARDPSARSKFRTVHMKHITDFRTRYGLNN